MCTGGFKLCKVLLIHSLSVLRTKETFLLEQMKQTSSGRCMKHLCGHKGRNVHYFHQIYKAVCTHGSLLLGMGVDIPLISGFNIKTLLAPQPIGYSSENNRKVWNWGTCLEEVEERKCVLSGGLTSGITNRQQKLLNRKKKKVTEVINSVRAKRAKNTGRGRKEMVGLQKRGKKKKSASVHRRKAWGQQEDGQQPLLYLQQHILFDREGKRYTHRTGY